MLVLIYRSRRDERLSWPWVAGWLHTEINVQHRELNPDTVAHLSTDRARRQLTSLIEANALVHPSLNEYVPEWHLFIELKLGSLTQLQKRQPKSTLKSKTAAILTSGMGQRSKKPDSKQPILATTEHLIYYILYYLFILFTIITAAHNMLPRTDCEHLTCSFSMQNPIYKLHAVTQWVT